MEKAYRVYDTEQKKYVTNERLWLITPDGTLYYLKTENAGFVKAHNCVVEWSSGLADKNNNDIFEGDILAYWTDEYQKKQYISVYYIDGQFKVTYYALNLLCGRNIRSEVVGNIHDNPELL